ncbi:hypothetical protein AA106_01730 [Photorhabdus laumondii subsp. laumondii]|nr:hypothetical protein A4R40_07155 [Photorhabdus laumondii subsp. laumondii]RAW73817.1 hypothetical protein CKY15_05030 [Photorhabdus sp. S7-51]RAW79514.1 hypothetical protein CKY06_03865 [Photorhabdus sp. S15-56]RAW84599.1 hypothetical protein CKY12_12410 [Photorhabdus sp. S12-55]AXG42023.1 hypothetical protein PluDJC_06965 [Photorhabdus laumondii subsp. laumondii]
MVQRMTSFFRAHIIIINENYYIGNPCSIARIKRIFSHGYFVNFFIFFNKNYLLSLVLFLKQSEIDDYRNRIKDHEKIDSDYR